jgi:putative DNA primase/helicase
MSQTNMIASKLRYWTLSTGSGRRAMSSPLKQAPSSSSVANLDLCVPFDLRERNQFVLWQYVERNGRLTKRPLQPSGAPASTTDPATWSSYAEVIAAFSATPGKFAGIGFVFSADDPFAGVDLDNSLDDGQAKKWSEPIIAAFGDSYMEISPSGKGVKIWLRAQMAGSGIKRPFHDGGVEIYDRGRFFTLTGNTFDGMSMQVMPHQAEMEELIKLVGSTPRLPLPSIGATSPITPGERHPFLVSVAARNGAKGMGKRENVAATQAVNLSCCTPPKNEWEVVNICDWVAQKEEANAARLASPAVDTSGNVDALTQEQLLKLDYTDHGNEQAFEIFFGDDFVYNCADENWHSWNGNYWEPDSLKRIDRRMLEVATARIAAAALLPLLDEAGGPLRKKAVAAARKLRNVNTRKSAMESATSNERFAHRVKDFDQNDFLFACANGVVDLRTGELRPGQRDDMLTKASHVIFDSLATCPRWLKFLKDIFADSSEMLAFIQRAVGYSLLGLTREEVLFILWGDGRNGKGTFLRVLLELLGDYGMNMDISALIADKGSGKGRRNDLAAMAGRRFVVTQESREGAQLDEALIKALTGGDLITARFLFKEHFTFRPTWKIWLATNHRPEIRGSDSGIWSRPKLIPFDVSFAGREDRGLKDALLDPQELSGILNWAVEGCLRYQEDGLQYPQVVIEATAQYKSDSDFIGRFIEECCVTGRAFSVAARSLYQALTTWVSDTGEKAITETAFGLKMKERKYEKARGAKGMTYTGIGFPVSGGQAERRNVD